jgi:hypothetical protein
MHILDPFSEVMAFV